MSSKLVILIVLFCLVDLSVIAVRSAPKSDGQPSGKSKTKKVASKVKKPLGNPLDLTNIDTSSYFRFTNARLGPLFALDVAQVKNVYYPKMGPVHSKQSQQWRFIEFSKGVYFIQNRFLGEDFVLDLIIQGQSIITVMNRKSSETIGQRWHVISADQGTFKLYNGLYLDGVFLDFYTADGLTYVSYEGNNDIGQYWTFDDVGPTENY